jgi:hypothetical protein
MILNCLRVFVISCALAMLSVTSGWSARGDDAPGSQIGQGDIPLNGSADYIEQALSWLPLDMEAVIASKENICRTWVMSQGPFVQQGEAKLVPLEPGGANSTIRPHGKEHVFDEEIASNKLMLDWAAKDDVLKQFFLQDKIKLSLAASRNASGFRYSLRDTYRYPWYDYAQIIVLKGRDSARVLETIKLWKPRTHVVDGSVVLQVDDRSKRLLPYYVSCPRDNIIVVTSGLDLTHAIHQNIAGGDSQVRARENALLQNSLRQIDMSLPAWGVRVFPKTYSPIYPDAGRVIRDESEARNFWSNVSADSKEWEHVPENGLKAMYFWYDKRRSELSIRVVPRTETSIVKLLWPLLREAPFDIPKDAKGQFVMRIRFDNHKGAGSESENTIVYPPNMSSFLSVQLMATMDAIPLDREQRRVLW